jgi:replicative DNA helicase
VVSAANIDAHARIILQKFIQRELIRISGEIISDSYEDSTDVFDLLDEAESNFSKLPIIISARILTVSIPYW